MSGVPMTCEEALELTMAAVQGRHLEVRLMGPPEGRQYLSAIAYGTDGTPNEISFDFSDPGGEMTGEVYRRMVPQHIADIVRKYDSGKLAGTLR